MEDVLKAWEKSGGSSDMMSPEARVRWVEPKIRLNALGFYTGAEQLSYKRQYAKLTGTGIFALGTCVEACIHSLMLA